MTRLDHIAIYAVEDGGELMGFSFDALPGSAERHHIHTPIDRADPGAPLLLAAFATPAQAQAFVAGLQYGRDDHCGCVIRKFAPGLAAVLVEFFDAAAPPCGLLVEDMRDCMEEEEDAA